MFISSNLEDQSTYHSKLFGLWDFLVSLKQLSDRRHITQGQVTIACNGLLALKKAQAEYPTEPEEAHYDLISAIKNLRDQLPIKLNFEHVKGHQDQGMIMALPWLVWMMESHAKTNYSLQLLPPNRTRSL